MWLSVGSDGQIVWWQRGWSRRRGGGVRSDTQSDNQQPRCLHSLHFYLSVCSVFSALSTRRLPPPSPSFPSHLLSLKHSDALLFCGVWQLYFNNSSSVFQLFSRFFDASGWCWPTCSDSKNKQIRWCKRLSRTSAGSGRPLELNHILLVKRKMIRREEKKRGLKCYNICSTQMSFQTYILLQCTLDPHGWCPCWSMNPLKVKQGLLTSFLFLRLIHPQTIILPRFLRGK